MAEECFDIARACEELKIDKTIYLRIVFRAIDQTLNDLKQLHQANQDGDIASVQAISHRLKGDYANLRINHLSDIARQLNILAKENYNAQEAAVLIEQFENVFEKMKIVLQESA